MAKTPQQVSIAGTLTWTHDITDYEWDALMSEPIGALPIRLPDWTTQEAAEYLDIAWNRAEGCIWHMLQMEDAAEDAEEKAKVKEIFDEVSRAYTRYLLQACDACEGMGIDERIAEIREEVG